MEFFIEDPCENLCNLPWIPMKFLRTLESREETQSQEIQRIKTRTDDDDSMNNISN